MNRFLLACFAVVFSATANAAIIDGKDWFQPASLLGMSPNEVSTACDGITGACNGQLNGIDVSGAKWASVEEVQDMIGTFWPGIPKGREFLDVRELDSVWAPAIMEVFSPTYSDAFIQQLYGITRSDTLDPLEPLFKFSVVISDLSNDADGYGRGTRWPNSWSDPNVGYWLYKEATTQTTVPLPASLFLFGIALAALCWTRKNR